GRLVVEHDDTRTEVAAGGAVLTPAGQTVRYVAGADGAEYVAGCVPAFAPELAGREDGSRPARRDRTGRTGIAAEWPGDKPASSVRCMCRRCTCTCGPRVLHVQDVRLHVRWKFHKGSSNRA